MERSDDLRAEVARIECRVADVRARTGELDAAVRRAVVAFCSTVLLSTVGFAGFTLSRSVAVAAVVAGLVAVLAVARAALMGHTPIPMVRPPRSPDPALWSDGYVEGLRREMRGRGSWFPGRRHRAYAACLQVIRYLERVNGYEDAPPESQIVAPPKPRVWAGPTVEGYVASIGPEVHVAAGNWVEEYRECAGGCGRFERRRTRGPGPPGWPVGWDGSLCPTCKSSRGDEIMAQILGAQLRHPEVPYLVTGGCGIVVAHAPGLEDDGADLDSLEVERGL